MTMRGAAFGFAIAAAVIAAASRPARAGSCGRGSGSSSGGGHGGTGVTGGPACRETTDVVGRRECGHFGAAWAGPARQPPITTEVAFFTRWLDTGFGVSGAMAHDTGTFDYQVSSRDDRDTVVGAALRVGSALPAHLYLGADFEVGGPVSGNRADVEMLGVGSDQPAPSMSASQALYMAAGGVGAIRGRLGPATLAAEVVAGVRMTSLSVESNYGACVLHDTHRHQSTFVEPRLKIGLWVNPWLTVAGFAGSDLVGDSRMVGASLAFHLRAFDRGW